MNLNFLKSEFDYPDDLYEANERLNRAEAEAVKARTSRDLRYVGYYLDRLTLTANNLTIDTDKDSDVNRKALYETLDALSAAERTLKALSEALANARAVRA